MPSPRKKKGFSSSARPLAGPGGKKATAKQQVVNLEMKGEHLKVYSLQRLLTNKSCKTTRAVAKLGDVLLPWYEKVVAKPAEKLDGIVELWQSLVPANLQNRCRLVGLVRGVLTVALDSTTMRAELDAKLRGGLLRELQTRSRGVIHRVKTCVQRWSIDPGL